MSLLNRMPITIGMCEKEKEIKKQATLKATRKFMREFESGDIELSKSGERIYSLFIDLLFEATKNDKDTKPYRKWNKEKRAEYARSKEGRQDIIS